MTLSIWRTSHLALAVSSFLFVLLASVTGLLLAFEPISDSLKPYALDRDDNTSISTMLTAAAPNYDEILAVKIQGRFLVADVMTHDGRGAQFYIDPQTGKPLGEIQPANAFFEFVRTLHRSLFLHGLGRFFMGLCSLLLLLIALTGTIMVVRRQRGLRHFFSKVVRDDFFSFYHVFLGRIWLFPIIVISFTGVLMSCDEFGFFAKQPFSVPHQLNAPGDAIKKQFADIAPFKSIPLSRLESLEFPFSGDPEDFYVLTLDDRQLEIDQYSGEIAGEKRNSGVVYWLDLATDLHTGRANIAWALILAIACVNILFFIYSGFAMTLRRRHGKVNNRFTPAEAEFIVLYGSENGSSRSFAKQFHLALDKAGKRSHLAQMDDYDTFASARQLILITSTYGNGEAPANATRFLERLAQRPQHSGLQFSVVGFGSHAYPDFCRFAYEVYDALGLQDGMRALLEIRTIADRDPEEFLAWVSEWSHKSGISLAIDDARLSQKPAGLLRFTVTAKTAVQAPDETFLLRFRPPAKLAFESGDLLAVFPGDDAVERHYSIGKISGEIQLCVKLHPGGVGSGYLNGLRPRQKIRARLLPNRGFHFPRDGKPVTLISNGTGIAPFLGMIAQNDSSDCRLYCGFRNSASFAPYRRFLERQLNAGRLSGLVTAFSREGNKQYVKDVLYEDRREIASVLSQGGTLLLCGSLAMQQDVLSLLDAICAEKTGHSLSHYQANGQVRMDCY